MSIITKLYRETEELLNDAKNVNEVSEKLLDIDEAFARFEKAHYDYYIPTISGNLEEWESEAGHRTNISQIAEFVKIKARAANNPVFGCVIDVARDRSDSQRRKPKPKRATLPDERGNAFITQEIDSREGQSSPGHKQAPTTRYAVCPVCNAAHPLAKCKIS